ncbi:MAG: hypothetical protein WD004_01675 [Actinomycetota bacterium]
MDPGTVGLIGGFIGATFGIAGGIYGSVRSLRATTTPEERRFVIRVTVGAWVAIVGLIAIPLALWLTGVVPAWVYWACFILFFALLGPAILWSNRRQAQLRGG